MAQDFILGKKTPPYGSAVRNKIVLIYFQYANQQIEYRLEVPVKAFNLFRRLACKSKRPKPQEIAETIFKDFEKNGYSVYFAMLVYWVEKLSIIPVKVSNKAHIEEQTFLLVNALSLYIVKNHDVPGVRSLWDWMKSDFMDEWDAQGAILDFGLKERSLLTVIDKEDKRYFFAIDLIAEKSLLDFIGKQSTKDVIRFRRYHSGKDWLEWGYQAYRKMFNEKVGTVGASRGKL
jgi:hypothetical protein